MKKILLGIIILATIGSAILSFPSCSCVRGRSENEVDDSTKIALEMERRKMEEPEFEIITTLGTMKVKLYSKTPKHRDNFVKLVSEKFYDGIRFHRVIDGFMIQTGDPYSRDTSMINAWGTGGPDYTIPAEFVGEYWHKKGALAAARKGDMANPKKASSGSQFYIVQDQDNCLHLDGQYTVFGEVVEGLDVIDRIASVPTDNYDRPVEDVFIERIVQIGLPVKDSLATADTVDIDSVAVDVAADTIDKK